MESPPSAPEQTGVGGGFERNLRGIRASGLGRFVVALILLGACSSVAAHPLGNNTINRQTAIHVAPAMVEVRYAMDMAEIPTFTEAQAADTDLDGIVSDAEWTAYAKAWANEVGRELELELDGTRVEVTLREPRWSLAPGAAGLFTLRLEALFRTPVYGTAVRLRYRDGYKPAQIGWKEIYVVPVDGAIITGGNVAQADRSKGLTQFPDAPGTSFPSELSAEAEFALPRPMQRAAGAAVAAARAAREPVVGARAANEPFAAPRGARASATAAAVVRNAPRPAVLGTATPLDRVEVAPPALPQAANVADPMLTASEEISEPRSRTVSIWQGAGSFFKLGVHHIATGWDHLAFLLGLLLLRQSLGQLVRVVTAFTVAHSLTLAAAANGWVTPPGALVEPAIALTIAYVGFVSLVWQRSRHSVALAFAFGLVHGFGFAGALAESLGAETARNGAWLVNLASFNLGIEAFQLLLVCILVPTMALATRYAWSAAATRVGSLGVLTAGLAWFFARMVDVF